MIKSSIKSGLFVAVALLLFPTASYAATLTLGGPNSVKAGEVFNVPVLLSTTQSANAVSGTVTFPTDLLNLVSLSKAGSIINLWPNDPSQSVGSASFEGVILNPGWTGTRGTIVVMTFTAKAAGTAAIAFSGDASVLANDGSATPILSGTSPTSITIAAAPKAATPTPTPKPTTKPTPAPTKVVTPAATTTPTTAPAVEQPVPPVPTSQVVLPPPESALSAFVHSTLFPNALWLVLAALLIFLAWHRYNRGVPPFYYTFEGKAPMTPPTPDELLRQFDKLKEAIKLEAISIQKIKEGQPLTAEEEHFLTLFKKLMNVVEGQ